MTSLLLLAASVLLMLPVIAGNTCTYFGRRLKANQGTLTPSCSLHLKCNPNGAMTVNKINGRFSYRCPANSRCNRQARDCQCNSGYVLASRDSFGLLKSCRSATQCSHGGKTYRNGAEWTRSDCRYRYKCVSGIAKGQGSHRCPANSYCKSGTCTCKTNFYTNQQVNGILKSCRPTKCTDNGVKYNYGDVWLERECRYKMTCNYGTVKSLGRYTCPANSHCSGGKCKCNTNYKQVSLNSDLLLDKCALIECNFFGKYYGNGVQWLNNECTSKFRCNGGSYQQSGYRCPANSRCTGGKCECNTGFKTSETSGNMLVSCKSNSCKLGSKTYLSGQQYLDNYCTIRYACVDGWARQTSFRCPPDSDCMYGECRCRENAQPATEDKFGITTLCGAPACRDGTKVYKLGDEWLQADCRRKYSCHQYGTRGGDEHRCPYHASCHSGKCQCDEGYKATSVDSKGFLVRCKSTSCVYQSSTKAHGEEWYQHGTDCKLRVACDDGDLKPRTSQCPANSSCKNNQCVCNPSYKETAQDSKGLLSACGR